MENPAPGSTWTQAQKGYNIALPVFPSLTNVVMGHDQFPVCLREYSLGIHNTKYTKALLTNTLSFK